jgi:DNA-binding transcriptional LysR family regulator
MTWDDLRYFLELARLKRLTHAGHKLGVDHTTVARRVEHLEQTLGCRLFELGADGYALTETGQRLFAHAESIESGIALLHDEAAGQSVRVSGVVRIGTPEGFGNAFLVPRLGTLLDEHPDLEIELLTLPRFPSLAAREADIIVTLDPPRQGRYIATRLTDFTYGLYASRDYLRRHGPIASVAELAHHRFAGYIDDLLLSPQLNYLDELAPRPRVSVACSGMLAQETAVRNGLCVAVLAHYLARDPDLVPLLPEAAVWTRTFWLATHADWYRLRRIRAVWDFLRRSVDDAPGFFQAAAAVRPRVATAG